MRRASVSFVWLLFASVGWSDVRLPAVFGDHMVLQREAPVPVWGWADAGEAVTVSVGGQKKTTTSGADGRWSVTLDPLKAGEPVELTVAGKTTRTFKDVLIGEVWIGSGQSNMAFTLDRAVDAAAEIAAAQFPKIRLFTVKRTTALEPQTDCEGSWSACSPETAKTFSAVAYFFGRELHRTLDLPVGLIHSSWGGTPAEAWTSRPALEAEPDFRPILDRRDQAVAAWPKAKAKHEQATAAWKAAAAKAKAEKKPAPAPPPEPAGPGNPHGASVLYNAMIAPLVPFAVRGAIWYQGEANAGRAFQYRKLLPAMIRDWRAAWGRGDFPFLIVQLANFKDAKPWPGDDDWAELREAQAMTLAASPNTGLAVTIDIGEAKDIHPKNKQDVGRRLARVALAKTYGKDLVWTGPVYAAMKSDEGKLRLTFRPEGGPPMAKGGGPLKGFAVAGEDKVFVWADAVIDGDAIVVSSPKVPKPVAARYAWASNPEGCNLVNAEGLPAPPFRTDDWPGVTDKNR